MVIEIDGNNLSIEGLVDVARNFEKVKLSRVAEKRIEEARQTLERIIREGKITYGINTGFGDLCTQTIPENKVEQLQMNLIRSHAVGVGKAMSNDVIRAVLLLTANSLSKGYSGVRAEIVKTIIEMLNKRLCWGEWRLGTVGTSCIGNGR